MKVWRMNNQAMVLSIENILDFYYKNEKIQ